MGVMVDKHGPKKLMIIGLSLAVIHPLVFSYIPEVSYLFIVYVISGLYWAFINSSWFTWQMNLIPSNKGVYAGFFSFINGLAWAFGPLLGGFLGDIIGLRYCALLSSSIVLLGLLIMLKVPETLEEERTTTLYCPREQLSKAT